MCSISLLLWSFLSLFVTANWREKTGSRAESIYIALWSHTKKWELCYWQPVVLVTIWRTPLQGWRITNTHKHTQAHTTVSSDYYRQFELRLSGNVIIHELPQTITNKTKVCEMFMPDILPQTLLHNLCKIDVQTFVCELICAHKLIVNCGRRIFNWLWKLHQVI